MPGYLRRRSKRGLKEAPGRTRYLTPQEEIDLLANATDEPRKAIQVAIDTGLRRDELFSLKSSQVDLLRGTITTTTLTKNGRRRKVPLPARSAQILAQIPRRLDTPFVLVNPGTGTRYVQMNKGLKAAMRRARITDLWLARFEAHGRLPMASARWQEHGGGFDPTWAFFANRH